MKKQQIITIVCMTKRLKSLVIPAFLMLGIMIAIGMIALASATTDNLGTYRQNNCINLIQTCSNCTYVNISNVISPSSVIYITESEMTKTRTSYNYTYCNTTESGEYLVFGQGDLDGTDQVWDYKFTITSSGEANTILYVIVWIFAFLILYILFIVANKIPLYRLFGAIMIMFNGLIGIFILDGVIMIIIGFTMIIFAFKEFMRFMNDMNITSW